MKKHSIELKRIWVALAGVLLIVSLTVFLSGSSVYGLDDDPAKTVLAFSSDVHNTEDNTAANRLDTWIDKVEKKCGDIDVMSFCGDMGSARAQEPEFWAYTQSVMKVVEDESINEVYTTGNHEFWNGSFADTLNSVKGKYIVGGEGTTGRNFIIYCLGTDNWEERGDSSRPKDSYTESQIEALTHFLDTTGNDKPIIILTHFPLHASASGNGGGGMARQTINADRVIDVLNEAADSGKKIVLLWGHNHTVKDTYYDQIYAPGDSIEYKSGSSAELNFYYGAAGCMSDSEYGSGSAFVKGKGLVITINDDKKLTFTYYDANANNVTEGGTYSEIPTQATDMVIDESVDESGETISQTIKAGKKLQLHVSVEPDNAYRRGLTWSSSDESVATVSQTGLVRGVSEGTVRITATIPDSDYTDEIYAAIDIKVGPKDKTPVFVLTDKLEAGKNYIIASQSTGTAFALTYDNDAVGATEVRIDGDRIASDNESIIFTAEENSGSGIDIRNEENYLQVGMGRMGFDTSAPNGRPWEYGTDKTLTTKSSFGNSYYYLYYDGSSFKAVRAATGDAVQDETVSREVYLFVQTEITPDPEPEPEPETDPEPEKKTAYITYDLGGGTYNGSTTDIVESYKTGDVITIHEAPERDGYTFSYWKGSKYDPGDSYTVSGDHTFTAVWEADDAAVEDDEDADSSGNDESGGRPRTGDRGFGLYLMLLLGSAAALTAMIAVRVIRVKNE